MNFMKGVMIGSIITAGTIMMYSDNLDQNRRKMMKLGKNVARRIKMTM